MRKQRHWHQSRKPKQTEDLSGRELRTLGQLQSLAHDHCSGGGFEMAAMLVKGKRRHYGFNRLNRKATTIDSNYPEPCGEHAELALYRRHKDSLKNSTVYVAGSHCKNDNPLDTTRPCEYCTAILDASEVRFVIYFQDGVATKVKPKELL